MAWRLCVGVRAGAADDADGPAETSEAARAESEPSTDDGADAQRPESGAASAAARQAPGTASADYQPPAGDFDCDVLVLGSGPGGDRTCSAGPSPSG